MSVEVSIARLPATNRELFGREGELSWLDGCWREGVHVACIVAWGGVGKSALVNAWLARVRDEGWRGAQRVYGWSFYSQGTDRLTSSDEFFSAALRWFGEADPTKGSPWNKGERLAELIRREQTLLILDGLEPLQWGPGVEEGKLKDPALQALVKELGAQNNGLCLITSRIALTDLEALGGDKVQAHPLDHLSPEAGAELLKARCAKGTDAALREAAEEYGGHSFSLTLLGSYIRKAHKGDIRKRDLIPPLEGKPAHRMMATYERWFESKPEQAILRMLGLFDRPAPEDEIAVLRAMPPIAGLTDRLDGLPESRWNEAVTTLRDVGLLAAGTEADERLDAHPLVREHFGEQLKQEQPEAWREGHRRLYEHLRKTAKALPETLEEMGPLYAAVVHGCQAGKNQEARDEVWWKRIKRKNKHFSTKHLGAFSSEVAVLSAFFDPPWERLAPGLSEPNQAIVLNQAGFALRALGRLPEAAGLMRLGLERRLAQENWKSAAVAASNLSDLLQARGDLSEALAQARKSVELADKSGDAFQRMGKRTMLAAALHAMGLREEAAAQFEEAERMQKERQPTYPLLYSLPGFWYCDLLLDQGRDADVRERAAQALDWPVTRPPLLAIALDHLSLGRAHLLAVQRGAAGDLAQATSHLKHAIDGFRRAGTQHYRPRGLLARAALHTHTRAFAEVRRDLDETLTLASRCGLRLHEADAYLGYARLHLAEGTRAPALEHLAKARRIIGETGYHRRDSELADLEAEAREMPQLPPAEEQRDREFRAKAAKSAKSEEMVFAPLAAFARNSFPLPPSPRLPSHDESTRKTPAPSRAMPTNPTLQDNLLDLGIVVALQEEFRELLALLSDYNTHKDDTLTSYRFERGPYRGVAAFVGDMGEAQATRVTERIITLWQPATIVVVGIAAGVHDDLRAGDVYVPPQAVQYLQDAKASPNQTTPDGFRIVLGAPAYRADFSLLDAVRNLEFNAPAAYRRWQADGRADLETLLPDPKARERLFKGDLVRRDLRLLADGHVATGPVVGAAAAFSTWIRTHDRNIKALEMESAAVLLAAQTRGTPKRALAIRGISDYGDHRKKALDEIGGGSLRRYAMRNAVRLLWTLLDAGALPLGEGGTKNPP